MNACLPGFRCLPVGLLSVVAPAAQFSAAPSILPQESTPVQYGLDRRDLEVLSFLDPGVEFEGAESLIGGFSVPDMPAVQRGREGYAVCSRA